MKIEFKEQKGDKDLFDQIIETKQDTINNK